MKGKYFLLVTGILMIMSAAATIFRGGLVGFVGVLFALLFDGLGIISIPVILAAFFAIVGGVLQLIAGIMGVIHRSNPAKADSLVAWGAIVLGLNILSIVLGIISDGFGGLFGLITALVIPGLFIYGAIQNKNVDDILA